MKEARKLAAQCWCDEETSGTEMDVVLAEAVARRIAAWMDTAAQMARNADYYRDLLDECAKLLGVAAYTSNDGTVQDEPLRLKIPEVMAALQKQLAAFKAQTAFPITINAPELKPGEKFVGVILSADGSRRHALILLPGEIEDANWKKASEWAIRQGGELPDRVEGALLFATLQDEFKPELYWTREQHAGLNDFAWCQYFSYGHQNYGTLKDNQCRARAVRRLAI